MELIEYIRIFRKWLWLLIFAAVLTVSAGYLIRSRQSAQYEARVLLEVGGFMQSPNPDTSEIRTGVELAQTYVILTETHHILETSIEEGDFPLTVIELQEIIGSRVVTGTSLLEITATYTEPILAADIANAVANQLILNSPTHLTEEQEQQIALINAEIASLIDQLQISRDRLSTIDEQLALAQDAEEIANLNAQRGVVASEVNEASTALSQFSDTVADLQARVNSLDIVEPARIPTEPIGPSTIVVALISGVLGTSAAAFGVLVFDYLDDTIKTPEAVVQHLALPVFGKISNFSQGLRRGDGNLIAWAAPDNFVAEEYRALRTQLLFASEGGAQALDTVITSVAPGEGKSVTTANLAVTLAVARYRVLVIDADLRRPTQHQLFNLKNDLGLTTLLAQSPEQVLKDMEHLTFLKEYEGCIQETDVPGLLVLTAGPLPANPTEALGSQQLQRWYEVFKRSPEIDALLIDTPPLMAVADATVIAATTRLPIMLVLRASKTRRSAVVESKAQMAQLGLKLRGVVLNDIKRTDMPYDRAYYYNYYSASDPTLPARTQVEVARPVASDNGRVLSLEHPQTKPLNGRPRISVEDIRALDKYDIMLVSDGDRKPLVLEVRDNLVLGRDHMELEAFEAFRQGVSRVHATIYRRDDGFYIEDLNSTNGTRLNERVLGPRKVFKLTNGDCVRLGNLQVWVYFSVEEDTEVFEDQTDA